MPEVQCSECNENMIQQSNGYLCPKCGQLDQFEEVMDDKQDSLCLDEVKHRRAVRVSFSSGQTVRRGKGRGRKRSGLNTDSVLGKDKKSKGGSSGWKC